MKKKNTSGPSDYDSIRASGKDELWETSADWGKRVFDEQYDDPAHFLLELLQNAEDALARRASKSRKPPKAKRGVAFELTEGGLRFRHFGDPFDRADVESICRIGQSTKNLDDIGRFGLGFKSVYAFTDRPRIHSGSEDFAIVGYFRPEACEPIGSRGRDETVIEIPRTSDKGDWDRLPTSLEQMLSPPNLLFLRHIESVQWTDVEGTTTICRRETRRIDREIRRVTITHTLSGNETPHEDHWLVFSRPVPVDRDRRALVEIAFRQDPERTTANSLGIQPVFHSRLYAYFPTNEDSHVGFLMQGPYNTTPARDSVRKHDEWNERLVAETATLVRAALRWMRNNGGITTEALRCLPLDRRVFLGTMFEPLFTEILDALCSEKMLPTYDGTHVEVDRVRLGRGDRLRRLFKGEDLGELCRVPGGAHWLRGDITRDSSPEVYRYVRHELKVQEFDPVDIVRRLSHEFLLARTDEWIRLFYEFLAEHESRTLHEVLRDKPIVRLADGSQIRPSGDNAPGIFLPGPTQTRFRTVRESVCDTDESLGFLESLGIREANIVDDVVENRLPAYEDDATPVGAREYLADLERIEAASKADSHEARERLVERLKITRWVKAVDSRGAASGWRRPSEVYAPAPLLRDLFDGTDGIHFWDPSVFRAESELLCHLLRECGATDRLRPVRPRLTMDEQRHILLREQVKGHGRRVDDWTLQGVRRVLMVIPKLDDLQGGERSGQLWRALVEWWREESPSRRERVCRGTARWSHHGQKQRDFPASFVVLLRSTAWVASGGALHVPASVVFSSTGWEDEPGLRSLLGFRDEEEARHEEEAGMLQLLEETGISSLEALRARLAGDGWREDPDEEEEVEDGEPLGSEAGVADGTLPEVAEWWDGTRDEERRKYETDAYPEAVRVDRLREGARTEWFTVFALACFRSYGRTLDTQHRGFVGRAISGGWWNDLANSRPPVTVEPWLEQLRRWSDAGQTLQDQEFSMWRRSFVSLYTVARWLDEYTTLMRRLPDIVEEAEDRISLREVLDPAYSPLVRKLGVEAAPLARAIGMGVNWMIRELLRRGFYERGGVMAPYAWMPSRRVRLFLEGQGLHGLGGNADDSPSIHDFVCGVLGPERADFHGDYDLPLQLWTRRRRERQ